MTKVSIFLCECLFKFLRSAVTLILTLNLFVVLRWRVLLTLKRICRAQIKKADLFVVINSFVKDAKKWNLNFIQVLKSQL